MSLAMRNVRNFRGRPAGVSPPPPPPGPPPPPVVPPPVPPPGIPDLSTPRYGYRLGNQIPYSPDPGYIGMGSARGPHGWHAANNELWMTPSPLSGGVVKFALVPPVMSPNIGDWPVLRPIGVAPNPWNESELNNYFHPDGAPKATYVNDMFYCNLTGSGAKMWMSFRSLYEPTLDYSEPVRAWAEDGEVFTLPGGWRHGQGCGFIKRYDQTQTRMGCIGAMTNAGLAGCSVINLDGTALMMPEDWGGVPNETTASWNSRCFIPPKTWLLGFEFPTDVDDLVYAVPSDLRENLGHLYNFPMVPACGAPIDGTETAMQQACLSDPDNAALVEALAEYIEDEKPTNAALLRKWGFWIQKWGCDQGYGSGLWLDNEAVIYPINCGLGDQLYEYQHFHIRPPGTSMVVSYALQKESRLAVYPLSAGPTVNPQPEWITLPQRGVAGLSYTPTGDISMSMVTAWADYDATFNLNENNPAVAVF